MKIGTKGLDLIKGFEKLVLKVYNDGYGFPTVGWGHLVKPEDHLKLGDTITVAQANDFLVKDLAIAEKEVNSKVRVPLNQNQFDALVSLIFNLGSFSKCPTLFAHLSQKDYAGTAEAFGRYVMSAGKKSNGLIRRRKEEKALFLSPVKSSPVPDPPAPVTKTEPDLSNPAPVTGTLEVAEAPTETKIIDAPEPVGFKTKLAKLFTGITGGTFSLAMLKEWLQIQISAETLTLLKIILPVLLAVGGIALIVWFVSEKATNWKLTKLKAEINSDKSKHDIEVQ